MVPLLRGVRSGNTPGAQQVRCPSEEILNVNKTHLFQESMSSEKTVSEEILLSSRFKEILNFHTAIIWRRRIGAHLHGSSRISSDGPG
jgi:hypothetical protein